MLKSHFKTFTILVYIVLMQNIKYCCNIDGMVAQDFMGT